MTAPSDSLEHSMHDFVRRHFFVNEDSDNATLLAYLGIYTCSPAQFFRFLETLTDPLTHETPEQTDIIARLSRHLATDGLCFKEIGRVSGSPRYQVQPIAHRTTPADTEISHVFAAFNPADISERWEEALRRRSTDPRAAVTIARTLLEDTCKWILHDADVQFEEVEDLPSLYKRLAKLLKLAPDGPHGKSVQTDSR
jgi:hypothetical protein